MPNDVQRLAFEAFVAADHVIDAEALEVALSRLAGRWAMDYEETFERLAPVQQRVPRIIARQPRGQVYGRAFLEEVDFGVATMGLEPV